MSQWYGSLSNRLDENHFFGEDNTIRIGTDVTEYEWSDSYAYYVTKVISQKHFFMKQYKTMPKGGSANYSNEWDYIKDEKEPEIEVVSRYGHWRIVNKDEFQPKTSKINISFNVRRYYFDYEF